LHRYSLVEWNSTTGRYRLHDLARDFTTLRLDEPMRVAADGRHAAYYKEVLAAAEEKYLSGGAAVIEGLALFDLEWGNIKVGQAWAAAYRERDQAAAQLCKTYPDAGVYVLALRQRPREQISWLDAALDSAKRLGDRVHEGSALGNLGIAYRSLGEYRRAIEFHEQHLAIARAIGHRRGESNALGNLGNAYHLLGEYRGAIEFHEQNLTIAREIGDRPERVPRWATLATHTTPSANTAAPSSSTNSSSRWYARSATAKVRAARWAAWASHTTRSESTIAPSSSTNSSSR
jgi:tetratricopeptide (TPR) repeat protein